MIAKNFARIFYRNSINIGLAIIECPEAVDAISDGDRVEADLDTGVITDVTTGGSFNAAPFPEFIQKLISAGGLVEGREGRSHRVRGNGNMAYDIALLRGDGIGPEIVDSAVKVLRAVGKKYGLDFNFTNYLIGGAAIDETGVPLPEETVKGCLGAQCVLLGAVGGPKWTDCLGIGVRRRRCLAYAQHWGLYTNLRPCQALPGTLGRVPAEA